MTKGKDALKEILAPNQYSLLFESSADAKEKYSASILTEEQIRLLPDIEDRVRYALAEDIAKNCPSELDVFAKYGTRNVPNYLKVCRLWLESECFLLEKRIHHRPSFLELIHDFEEKKLCQKRRVFYLLTYPKEIEELDSIPPIAPPDEVDKVA